MLVSLHIAGFRIHLIGTEFTFPEPHFATPNVSQHVPCLSLKDKTQKEKKCRLIYSMKHSMCVRMCVRRGVCRGNTHKKGVSVRFKELL